MKRAPLVAIMLSAGLFGLAGSTGAGAAEDASKDPASRNLARLGAVLVGGNEVPGPGDPNGYGLADVWVKRHMVCWRVTTSEVAALTGAHIHAGKEGVSGPVVVALTTEPRGCTEVPRRTARFLAWYPDQFYVNLHNEEYPGGAVRGQLTH